MSEDRENYRVAGEPQQVETGTSGPPPSDPMYEQAVRLNYELRRSLDAARNTIRRYSESLDGFGAAGVEGARTPDELHDAFAIVVGALQGTYAALEEERKQSRDEPAKPPVSIAPPPGAWSIDEVLSRKRSMITRRLEMYGRELNRDLNELVLAVRNSPEMEGGEMVRHACARTERIRGALDRVCSLLEGFKGQKLRDYAAAIREQGGIDADGAIVEANSLLCDKAHSREGDGQ